jgi:hypothetical protein
MAQYTATVKANGEIVRVLRFLGETFTQIKLPAQAGLIGDPRGFDIRLKEHFPDLEEKYLKLVGKITHSEEETVEAIAALQEYEQAHNWSDEE